MPPKKNYPKNATMQVAMHEIEQDAILREAAAEGIRPSEWIYRRLWSASLRSAVAKYYPDDVPKMERERSDNGRD